MDEVVWAEVILERLQEITKAYSWPLQARKRGISSHNDIEGINSGVAVRIPGFVKVLRTAHLDASRPVRALSMAGRTARK